MAIVFNDSNSLPLCSSRPGRPPKRASVGLTLAASHLAATTAHHAQLKKHRMDNGDYYENGHLGKYTFTPSQIWYHSIENWCRRSSNPIGSSSISKIIFVNSSFTIKQCLYFSSYRCLNISYFFLLFQIELFKHCFDTKISALFIKILKNFEKRKKMKIIESVSM